MIFITIWLLINNEFKIKSFDKQQLGLIRRFWSSSVRAAWINLTKDHSCRASRSLAWSCYSKGKKFRWSWLLILKLFPQASSKQATSNTWLQVRSRPLTLMKRFTVRPSESTSCVFHLLLNNFSSLDGEVRTNAICEVTATYRPVTPDPWRLNVEE